MDVPAAARIRADRVRAAFSALPPITHVGQAAIFAALAPSDPIWAGLAGLSVLAVVWFGGAELVRRSGRTWLSTWMGWAEVLGHSTVLHLAIGPNAWFRVYPVVLSIASLGLFRADEPRSRAAGFVIALAVAALEAALPTPPWLVADPRFVELMGALNALTAVVCTLVFVVVLVGATERAEVDAEREHARAEDLLRNLLPASVAERLKREPGRLAQSVPDVTVLFADLVGFTPMAAVRSAPEVVAVLDQTFTRFDAVVAAHGLCKIKTIGDAYLAVAGLPDPHPDGPAAAAAVALALVDEVARLSRELGVDLRLRVGLHTGPVVAGVIGSHRRAYDLWGDSVNVASRMESHGEPGRVHVTAATADRLRGRFAVRERGAIEVKGRGPMQTFWVEPITRPPASTP